MKVLQNFPTTFMKKTTTKFFINLGSILMRDAIRELQKQVEKTSNWTDIKKLLLFQVFLKPFITKETLTEIKFFLVKF